MNAGTTLLGREALGDAIDRLIAAVQPSRVIVGWATIDLDRLGDGVDAPEDRLLGARCRRLAGDRVGLEPTTEGRLAASLAKFGEGPIALYLVGGQVPAVALSADADGPFGRQRLVLGGPRWGPHLLLAAGADGVEPATIEP